MDEQVSIMHSQYMYMFNNFYVIEGMLKVMFS